MARAFPFRGIYYNRKKIKNLSKVMAPPYDVISPEFQDELYEMDDFNIIRLILGKDFPGDGEYNNKYVRASAFMNGWLRHKILLRDDKPALFAYEQKFTARGKKFTRTGFISILRLEDLGKGRVFPHEETYPKAKLDRLQLFRATNANFESIFSLYSDEKNKVLKALKSSMRGRPLIEAKDKDGVLHRLWRIDRKPAITRVLQEMKDKSVFIADGHHRYEASIRLKDELKLKNTKFTEDEAYNHIMMYFTPLEERGLLVFPIHRVLRDLTFFDPIRFEQDLSHYFDVVAYKANKKTADKTRKKLIKDLEKAGQSKHAFGVYLGNYRYLLLTLRDENIMDELIAEDRPKAWKRLDVTILHYTVFDRLLNIAKETEDKVIYTKSEDEGAALVDEKGCNLAFFLNPTKIEEIISISSKLEKLPHKSTYFWPKLLSGLVMHKFEYGEKVKA
jgi:uncharacterized protein (DUF1015 family)